MPEYRVTWEIDLEAASPEEAAIKALEIQRDFFSQAVVFTVSGHPDLIDLEHVLGEGTQKIMPPEQFDALEQVIDGCESLLDKCVDPSEERQLCRAVDFIGQAVYHPDRESYASWYDWDPETYEDLEETADEEEEKIC